MLLLYHFVVLLCHFIASRSFISTTHQERIPEISARELINLLTFSALGSNPADGSSFKSIVSNTNLRSRVLFYRTADTDPDPDDIPINFKFHNFPDTAYENAAKHGVIDALRLANAALAATVDRTSSFYRYFQDDEVDLVRRVFESIMSESIFAPCTDSHIVHIWYDDLIIGFDGCAQGLAAYHVTPGPGVTGLNIVLCSELFRLYPQPLDEITVDRIGKHASEAMETVGLTVLHEITHLQDFVGGFVISDTYVNSPFDVTPSNPLGYVKVYGAYLSMLVNKEEDAGGHNADNFAFFAAESFFMQEYDIQGFEDPPPTGSEQFHPSRRDKMSFKGRLQGTSHVLPREIPMVRHAYAGLRISIAEPLPPFRLPGPGWPQNFLFINFPSDNDFVRDVIIEGLIDTWRLADAALEGLSGSLTKSYHRYFQEDDFCEVEDIFHGILQEAAIPVTPTSHDLREWKIYYDDTTLADPKCHEKESLAYFIESATFANPTIVVCPAQLEYVPRVLNVIDCSEIGSSASEGQMDNIGATLLHEMLHDYGMTGDAAGVFADDVEFEVKFQKPDGTTSTRIVTGYGPYWSQYINTHQHAGSSNVDNYVWFAIETFFSQKCNVDFGDPAMGQADGPHHPAFSVKELDSTAIRIHDPDSAKTK